MRNVFIVVAGGNADAERHFEDTIQRKRSISGTARLRSLTRLTFDEGLQIGATWSPDSRYIAYSSDRGGKFDIWVQQVSGGDPVQITKGPGHHLQPDWSPDGKYIVYRSEHAEGGLFVAPPLGGEGLERRVASFGYHPHWSPDSSQILFQTHSAGLNGLNRLYVVGLHGEPPREVLREFIARLKLCLTGAVWHPDGKRISIWGWDPSPSPTFWTIPLEGGPAIQSEIPPSIERQFVEMEAGTIRAYQSEMSFSWSPAGDAIYFEAGYRGASNIWKMAVDADTLQATAVERLTTGPGPDSTLALSIDGRRLAFTAKSERVRNWLFPFDATLGRITGNGEPVSTPGRTALVPTMSRDGKKVAFCVSLGGKFELWEASTENRREAPIVTDEYDRRYAQWSPDGTQLAYTRSKPGSDETQIMMWSYGSHSEEQITASSKSDWLVYDWSSDGRTLLVSRQVGEHHEIWQMPLAAAPYSDNAAKQIAASPTYELWQPHYSPNGRWIVFQAAFNTATGVESTLYVVPARGGSWRKVTEGKGWADKPRWSPDGKTIFFVASRNGFFGVWGIRFDEVKGKASGDPFLVSAFEKPSLMIPQWIETVALSITQNKLMLTLKEASGGVWILDNVDH